MKPNGTSRFIFNLSSRTAALLAATAALAVIVGSPTLIAKPPGQGTGNQMAVAAAFLNQPGDCLRSDYDQPYIDGEDGVTAVITDSGQLDVALGQRDIITDYSEIIYGTACDVDDTKIEVPDINCNGQADDPLVTEHWAHLYSLDVNLLSMKAGETQLKGFAVNFGTPCKGPAHIPWRIRFNNQGTWDSIYVCDPECSAPVTVQAFDEDPNKGIDGTGVDTWIITVEASGGSGAEACLWSGGTGDPVLREIVRMPFHLVVTLK